MALGCEFRLCPDFRLRTSEQYRPHRVWTAADAMSARDGGPAWEPGRGPLWRAFVPGPGHRSRRASALRGLALSGAAWSALRARLWPAPAQLCQRPQQAPARSGPPQGEGGCAPPPGSPPTPPPGLDLGSARAGGAPGRGRGRKAAGWGRRGRGLGWRWGFGSRLDWAAELRTPGAGEKREAQRLDGMRGGSRESRTPPSGRGLLGAGGRPPPLRPVDAQPSPVPWAPHAPFTAEKGRVVVSAHLAGVGICVPVHRVPRVAPELLLSGTRERMSPRRWPSRRCWSPSRLCSSPTPAGRGLRTARPGRCRRLRTGGREPWREARWAQRLQRPPGGGAGPAELNRPDCQGRPAPSREPPERDHRWGPRPLTPHLFLEFLCQRGQSGGCLGALGG